MKVNYYHTKLKGACWPLIWFQNLDKCLNCHINLHVWLSCDDGSLFQGTISCDFIERKLPLQFASLNGEMWALNKGLEVECFILCILWSMERKTEMSLLLCSSWAIFQLLHHLFHKLVFMYPIIIFLILRCLQFLIFFNIKGDIPSFSIWGDFPPFRHFLFWEFHHSIILCCRVTHYVRTLTINCYWKE